MGEQKADSQVAMWAVVVTVIAAISTYIGAYFSMVRPDDIIVSHSVANSDRGVSLSPDYSGKAEHDGESVRNQRALMRFFAPIHWLDRKARPKTWNWHRSP